VGVEERLERLEQMLADIARRLERLETMLAGAGEEARLAVTLAQAFTKPLHDAAKAAKRAMQAINQLRNPDDITKAIIQALAAQGPLTLRGLEREVRRLRGTASRQAIKERLALLHQQGVVCVEQKGRKMVVSLADGGCPGDTPRR